MSDDANDNNNEVTEGITATVELFDGEPAAKAPAVADDVLPDSLYLIPVPQRPFFPGQVQPVAMDPEEWGGTLNAVAEEKSGIVGLVYVDQQQLFRSQFEQRLNQQLRAGELDGWQATSLLNELHYLLESSANLRAAHDALSIPEDLAER